MFGDSSEAQSLFDQLNPNTIHRHDTQSSKEKSTSSISLADSAIATFYAPSDISGIAGMRREYSVRAYRRATTFCHNVLGHPP